MPTSPFPFAAGTEYAHTIETCLALCFPCDASVLAFEMPPSQEPDREYKKQYSEDAKACAETVRECQLILDLPFDVMSLVGRAEQVKLIAEIQYGRRGHYGDREAAKSLRCWISGAQMMSCKLQRCLGSEIVI